MSFDAANARKRAINARKCFRGDITRLYNIITNEIDSMALTDAQAKLSRLLEIKERIREYDDIMYNNLISLIIVYEF